VVGTVTVIGIFSLFCTVVRFTAIMAPFLNNIRIHGCSFFHVVPEFPTMSVLFSIMAACNQMLLRA
jgi:hypothetical protein